MTENEIATSVVDAAFLVHTRLGSGLLESVYEGVLRYELNKARDDDESCWFTQRRKGGKDAKKK